MDIDTVLECWWEKEGSGISPIDGEDSKDHVLRVLEEFVFYFKNNISY